MLRVSWLLEAKASIQIAEGSLVVDTTRTPYKLWLEPAVYVNEGGICVYYNRLTVIRPGRSVGIPARHLEVIGREVFLFSIRTSLVSHENFFKSFLKMVSLNNALYWVKVERNLFLKKTVFLFSILLCLMLIYF